VAINQEMAFLKGTDPRQPINSSALSLSYKLYKFLPGFCVPEFPTNDGLSPASALREPTAIIPAALGLMAFPTKHFGGVVGIKLSRVNVEKLTGRPAIGPSAWSRCRQASFPWRVTMQSSTIFDD
jgi:hypothetical protein